MDSVQVSEQFLERWMQLWKQVLPSSEDLFLFQLKLGSALLEAFPKKAMETVSSVKDKRFADDSWHALPLFKSLKDNYLEWGMSIQETLNSLDDWEPLRRQKMDFFMRQCLNAFSPSNFFWTNPEVLNETLKKQGENLMVGCQHVLEDAQRNPGFPNFKMTQLEAFEVGQNLACTPGSVIFKNRLFELIQYTPQTAKVYQTPLLIVPPWINKYYILDLSPDNSWVRWLVEQGHTVFMISWVNPTADHQYVDFEDYAFEGLLIAIGIIQSRLKVDQINAVGFCIGGTLLASTLAYLAAQKKFPVASATYLATMLDFSEPGDLGLFAHSASLEALEQLMKPHGYLDGRIMAFIFNLLRENDLIWPYYVNNYLKGRDPLPFDLLYWNSDPSHLPAKMQLFYLENMYQKNLLKEPGGIAFKGVPLDLRAIQTPAYFLSTEQDHIALWRSTYQGALIHGETQTFVLGGSGHIAGVVNPIHKKKYGYRELPMMEDAQLAFEQSLPQEGSWWPHWQSWIQKYAGKKVSSRNPEQEGEVLYAAPGTYVRVKI